MFKKHSIVPVGRTGTDARNNEGYFCSELVAAAYKKIGLLEARKSSSQYWPGNDDSIYLIGLTYEINLSHLLCQKEPQIA